MKFDILNEMVKVKTKVTPVRYPGGKSNALKFLDTHLIKDFSNYREPFFGGGSVGLYLMQINKDADYWINDLFYPVYCFWKTLYEDPDGMVTYIQTQKARCTEVGEIIKKGTPSQSATRGAVLHKACREIIKETITNKDIFKTACLWYILNKLSYSGMAMIGSYAPLAWDQNFTDNCIKNLPKTSALMRSVNSLKITNLDYSELLKPSIDNTFIFLDPPYDIKDNLYGNNGDMHRGFDHLKFYEDVNVCNHKWMITYNDNPTLVKRFAEYNQLKWDLQYTMKAAKRVQTDGSTADIKTGKKGKELLIANYPLTIPTSSSKPDETPHCMNPVPTC